MKSKVEKGNFIFQKRRISAVDITKVSRSLKSGVDNPQKSGFFILFCSLFRMTDISFFAWYFSFLGGENKSLLLHSLMFGNQIRFHELEAWGSQQTNCWVLFPMDFMPHWSKLSLKIQSFFLCCGSLLTDLILVFLAQKKKAFLSLNLKIGFLVSKLFENGLKERSVN